MSTSFDNVSILRALIALCKRDIKLPTDIYDLGYTQIVIEGAIGLENSRSVMPDLVMSSRKENHCVVWESKSGRNIDNDQAKRLADIEAKAFTDQLTLDVKMGDDFAFDVAYACDGQQSQNIRVDLDRVAGEVAAVGAFPLVGFYEEWGIKTHSGRFGREGIHGVLAKGIELDLREVPTEYLRFDKDSRRSDIASYVIPNIVAYAVREEPRFSAEQIARDSYGSSWKHIHSTTMRDEVAGKIDSILRDAMQNELNGYLTRPGRGRIRSPNWSLSYLNRRDVAFPSRRLKKLEKQCTKFVNRLKKEEAGVYARQLRFHFFLEEE